MRNISTFGLEIEFFVKDPMGRFVEITEKPGIPQDSCGWLAEARGEYHRRPREAVALLSAAIQRLGQKTTAHGLKLAQVNTADLDKQMLRRLIRHRGKHEVHSKFMYGGEYKTFHPRAGLHVHFGTSQEIEYTPSDGKAPVHIQTVVAIADIPSVVIYLDSAFSEEIKAAKRIKGEYELKPHGFEYRSLPNTVDFGKLADVLEKLDALT